MVVLVPKAKIQAEPRSRRRGRRRDYDFAHDDRRRLDHFLDHNHLFRLSITFFYADTIAADMNGAIVVMVMRFFGARVDDLVRSRD